MLCPDKQAPDENKGNATLAYNAKVDAWACGVLAYELLVGCPPFGMSTREGSVKAILYQKPKVPQWLAPAASDFITWALTKKASRRPSVGHLLQHPWIVSHMCALQLPSHGLDVACFLFHGVCGHTSSSPTSSCIHLRRGRLLAVPSPICA
jgi:serine/threonine protein kinase